MDFDFQLETITPTQTSTLVINATGSLVLPSGGTSERPPDDSVKAGATRWNIDTNTVETWTGSSWTPHSTSYVHTQSIPADSWIIPHNMGRIPSIVVLDSTGDEVEGSYTHPDLNTAVLSFSASFGGKAYIS